MLTAKRCTTCNAATPRIEGENARVLLREIPGFELDESATQIARTFQFTNFYETMAFVNALAYVAHREDHHPELEVSYKTCRVTFSTHANGGLSENDFICAAKANALKSQRADLSSAVALLIPPGAAWAARKFVTLWPLRGPR